MTTYSRTTVDCDFDGCHARSEYTVLGAARARREATATGWQRWADTDFCPAPQPAADNYSYTPEAFRRPRNHAALLTGEHQPTLVRMPPKYKWDKSPQWRVTCACGWDGDAESPHHTRKFAAKSWTKHVKEELKRRGPDEQGAHSSRTR